MKYFINRDMEISIDLANYLYNEQEIVEIYKFDMINECIEFERTMDRPMEIYIIDKLGPEGKTYFCYGFSELYDILKDDLGYDDEIAWRVADECDDIEEIGQIDNKYVIEEIYKYIVY